MKVYRYYNFDQEMSSARDKSSNPTYDEDDEGTEQGWLHWAKAAN